MQTFDNHGLRFEYPSDWSVAEERTDEEIVITVSSDETAFWSVSVYFERPAPDQLIASALATFREVYEEVDAYESTGEELFDIDALGSDVEFVCLELINTAWIRAVQTDQFTAAVLAQFTDLEREDVAPILNRITKSLTADLTVDPLQQWFSPEQ